MLPVVIAGVCFTATTRAQTIAPRPGRDSLSAAAKLKEVIVNAQRISLRNVSATPAQLFSKGDLEAGNTLSVADAIRYFSGVQLKDYGGVGGLKTINVRSMGSNHTAVFYDGVELGNAQNGQVDLGKFSLDNIEEISLYDGQRSTIFQPAKGFSSASSLYLSPVIPRFDSGRVSSEKINLRSGSAGLIDPSFLFNGKLSASTSLSFNTEYIHASGRYKFNYSNGVYDTTAVRQNGDIDAFRAELGLTGRNGDHGGWSARGYYYQSQRGLPGAIIANKFDYTQRQWDRNIFIQSSYHADAGRYSLLVNGKYANDHTRYLDPEYVTTTGFLDNRYAQQEIYFSAANRYRLNEVWDIALSGDYQWNKLDANLYHFAYPVRNSVLVNGATEWHFPRWNLQANLLATAVTDQVKQFTAAGNKTAFTPAVLFSWVPFAGRNFRLRAFYKRIFRLPTFNDLYYTFVGNTLLKPEYATQYDAGLTYSMPASFHLLKSLSFQADAYYNQVSDKIVAVPGANLFRWTMYNLGKVAIRGLELNLQTGWSLPGAFILRTGITYTYQQALDITGGDNYKQQIPYTPLNSGSLIAALAWKTWSVNYSFLYTGSRYDESANIDVNYLQPWYTHDISLGWQPRRGMKCTAEINNFLNQHYDVISNFPMPGRSYRITLSYAM